MNGIFFFCFFFLAFYSSCVMRDKFCYSKRTFETWNIRLDGFEGAARHGTAKQSDVFFHIFRNQMLARDRQFNIWCVYCNWDDFWNGMAFGSILKQKRNVTILYVNWFRYVSITFYYFEFTVKNLIKWNWIEIWTSNTIVIGICIYD